MRVRACACVLGSPDPPVSTLGDEARSLDFRTLIAQNFVSKVAFTAGRPAWWTLRQLWAHSPRRELSVALEIEGIENAGKRRK